MTIKYVAEYGRWHSTISAEAATAGTRALSSPRAVATEDGRGRGFFLVSKDDGSSTVYEATDPPRRVLPEPWGVGTTVYEYGGQAYAVWGDSEEGEDKGSEDGSEQSEDKKVQIVFADSDNSCNVLDVATGAVRQLVAGVPTLRYGDFDASGSSAWILAVQEDHADARPAGVRNYIVAIHRTTGAVVRVVEGADFYSYPRWAPGRSASVSGLLSWREWDHPDLPFDGVTLHWARWDADTGALTDRALVAGADRQCVAEAVWAPDGSSLVFGMEADEAKGGAGFRQLFRVRPGCSTPVPIVLDGLEDVEFGDASWFIGCQTIVFLTPSTIVAAGTRYSQSLLVYVDLDTGAWTSLDGVVGNLVSLKFDPLAALSPTSFLVIGSGFTTPQAVYRVDLDLQGVSGSRGTPGSCTLLFRSTDQDFSPDTFSTPELITVQNDNLAAPGPVYGWFWPPHNRKFAAPAGTLPPLIITPHGGPTGYTAPGLNMVVQYWATRGYACFAINYSGSSGHGRAYRDRLWARWGILDRDDVAVCVRHLTGQAEAERETPRADARRVGIEGGSAGGYNVLQSLVHYPRLFAGGVCCCGVADTAALGRDTHKLESHYLDGLLWGGDGSQLSEAEKQAIHYARSPVFHAARIEAPLRLIHGDRDTVVPIAQSRSIAEQIGRRGGDVDLVVLAGEGHMFVKTASKLRYLTAEAEWWEKTLLGDKGDEA